MVRSRIFQGRDRVFQLEMIVRVVRGTLAELVGVKDLPLDRLSRRIGFARSAERQLEATVDHVRRLARAFVTGVNDGSTVGCRRAAHEFRLLGVRPTPCRDTDILAAIKLRPFLLRGNWATELALLKILESDGAEALVAVDPGHPEWLPVTAPPGAAVFEFFMHEMARRVVERKAPRSARWAVGCGNGQVVTHTAFALRRAGLLARLPRESPEGRFRRGWEQEMADALAAIVRELR